MTIPKSCGCARPSPLRRSETRSAIPRVFRRSKFVAALLEHLLRILIGYFGPFSDLVGRNGDKADLAIFGGPELGLVVLEIGGQRLRRRRIDGPGMRGVKFDVFDRTLFVLEAAQRLDHRLWRLKPGGDGAGNLSPQRYPALIGDVALFAEPELADQCLEALRIEVAADALEVGIVDNHAHGFRIGLPEPQPS